MTTIDLSMTGTPSQTKYTDLTVPKIRKWDKLAEPICSQCSFYLTPENIRKQKVFRGRERVHWEQISKFYYSKALFSITISNISFYLS